MEAKDYIAAIRTYGLTQVQISQKTGIPQSTISKIERGDVQDVMSRNYRALQALLAELADQPDANGVDSQPQNCGQLMASLRPLREALARRNAEGKPTQETRP
jgi:transcriptional regulator with XRE-family HTH domain